MAGHYLRGLVVVSPFFDNSTCFYRQLIWLLNLDAGTCSVVIRMARDFGPEALPIDGSTHYFPTTGSSPVQRNTWSEILGSLDALYGACVRDGERAGWATVGSNIIVAYWARSSIMNQRYGIRARSGIE